MTQALRDIVEEAWSLFDMPRPASHQACTTCCLEADHDREFFAVPARNLSNAFMNDWYMAVFYGPASPSLARYLLPRILQATLDGSDFAYAPELNLNRLRTGDGDFWSDAETDLIARFRHACLGAMRGTTRGKALDAILCMFALDGHEAGLILDQVWAWPDKDLVGRLYEDWHRVHSIWMSSFWDTNGGCYGADETVYAWYVSPVMQDRLLNVAVDTETPDDLRAKTFTVLNCIAAG